MASAVASMRASLMLCWNVFHEFQPIGGVAAITPEVDASVPPASAPDPDADPDPELEALEDPELDPAVGEDAELEEPRPPLDPSPASPLAAELLELVAPVVVIGPRDELPEPPTSGVPDGRAEQAEMARAPSAPTNSERTVTISLGSPPVG
jgi:hypothetical protein